jgi:hypothetical protein
LSGLITASAVKIMGAFAKWQPAYAASGIATFPVIINDKDKRPAVSGYLKVGLEYSNQLSLKFPANDSFGFALGVRSRVTVLDVDTSDERVLGGADRIGPSQPTCRNQIQKAHPGGG